MCERGSWSALRCRSSSDVVSKGVMLQCGACLRGRSLVSGLVTQERCNLRVDATGMRHRRDGPNARHKLWRGPGQQAGPPTWATGRKPKRGSVHHPAEGRAWSGLPDRRGTRSRRTARQSTGGPAASNRPSVRVAPRRGSPTARTFQCRRNVRLTQPLVRSSGAPGCSQAVQAPAVAQTCTLRAGLGRPACRHPRNRHQDWHRHLVDLQVRPVHVPGRVSGEPGQPREDSRARRVDPLDAKGREPADERAAEARRVPGRRTSDAGLGLLACRWCSAQANTKDLLRPGSTTMSRRARCH